MGALSGCRFPRKQPPSPSAAEGTCGGWGEEAFSIKQPRRMERPGCFGVSVFCQVETQEDDALSGVGFGEGQGDGVGLGILPLGGFPLGNAVFAQQQIRRQRCWGLVREGCKGFSKADSGTVTAYSTATSLLSWKEKISWTVSDSQGISMERMIRGWSSPRVVSRSVPGICAALRTSSGVMLNFTVFGDRVEPLESTA